MNNPKLTPAQKAGKTRTAQKPLTTKEIAALAKIATLKGLWEKEGDWEFWIKVADLYPRGCDIQLQDYTKVVVTVQGNDVTKIGGPWYKMLREQLPTMLKEAQEYHDNAPKRKEEQAKQAKKEAAAKKAQVRAAAKKAFRG